MMFADLNAQYYEMSSAVGNMIFVIAEDDESSLLAISCVEATQITKERVAEAISYGTPIQFWGGVLYSVGGEVVTHGNG
ncbi:hypothetical protein F0249_19200 [Vibrio sp. 03-59-1]|uniref:hypothetical protein n=1 Tax=Vibrio sp. 03-59-1 TaxID=2607607 RepID=UPI0014934929|nr:hypothetical protein [Vibrio sp. 03-59-1]NOH85917.1 hypothetical protein [Vibrio sp. 03-59-1]